MLSRIYLLSTLIVLIIEFSAMDVLFYHTDLLTFLQFTCVIALPVFLIFLLAYYLVNILLAKGDYDKVVNKLCVSGLATVFLIGVFQLVFLKILPLIAPSIFMGATHFFNQVLIAFLCFLFFAIYMAVCVFTRISKINIRVFGKLCFSIGIVVCLLVLLKVILVFFPEKLRLYYVYRKKLDCFLVYLKNMQFLFILAFILASCAIFIKSYFIVGKHFFDISIQSRIKLLSIVVTISSLLVISYNIGSCLFKRKSYEPAKHVVMFVLDGFPTEFIKAYNPKIHDNEFDFVKKAGKVFIEARTNKVFTVGYFGVLYSGRLDINRIGSKAEAIGNKEYMDLKNGNLLNILQTNGIKTRLITFHRNGVPETNYIDGYKGLRAYFFTEHLDWVPSILGYEYTVLLSNKISRESLWSKYIFKQIKDMQKQSQSFLLFHLNYLEDSVQDKIAKSQSNAETNGIYRYLEDNDGRYKPEHENFVRVLREDYRYSAKFYGKSLERLIDVMQQASMLDNTLVIVTADHGTITSKNKFGYGYHPDEEVTRVPLMLFGCNQHGISSDMVDTQDISQTIVEFFDINKKFAKNGRSLLKPMPVRAVPVFTQPALLKEKNHYLVMYKNGFKYLFDIFYDSPFGVRSEVSHYDEKNKQVINERDIIWHDCKQMMQWFNVEYWESYNSSTNLGKKF